MSSQDGQQLRVLMSFAGCFTLLEDAVQNLETVRFDDDEIEALATLDVEHRLMLVARLVELEDSLQESARDLAGRVLQLTGASLLASEEGS